MRKTKKMLAVEERFHQSLEHMLPEKLTNKGLTATADELGVSKATLGYWLLKLGISVERVAVRPGETVHVNRYDDPGGIEYRLQHAEEDIASSHGMLDMLGVPAESGGRKLRLAGRLMFLNEHLGCLDALVRAVGGLRDVDPAFADKAAKGVLHALEQLEQNSSLRGLNNGDGAR